jgi:hypothetical protein
MLNIFGSATATHNFQSPILYGAASKAMELMPNGDSVSVRLFLSARS